MSRVPSLAASLSFPTGSRLLPDTFVLRNLPLASFIILYRFYVFFFSSLSLYVLFPTTILFLETSSDDRVDISTLFEKAVSVEDDEDNSDESWPLLPKAYSPVVNLEKPDLTPFMAREVYLYIDNRLNLNYAPCYIRYKHFYDIVDTMCRIKVDYNYCTMNDFHSASNNANGNCV